VSKARKIAIAGLLLVGGYVAAIVLGGVPELIFEPAEPGSQAADDASWLTGVENWLASDEPAKLDGQLVPDAPVSSSAGRPAANLSAKQANRPTWLNTTDESQAFNSPLVTRAPASHPEPAEPPHLIESTPLAAAPISISSQPATLSHSHSAATAPRARITEVRPVAAAASQPAASPWDRWPRSPTDDAGVQKQAVPATFQDLSMLPVPEVQPSLHEAEIVRKNTPPRDLGAAPAESLRTHIVIDGDTLIRLAERYLDDPTRSPEIYRLNRDVLTSPELLPIGVELRIPDRARPGEALASLAPAANADGANANRAEMMVPVPWAPRPLAEMPQAKLLRPVPTAVDN